MADTERLQGSFAAELDDDDLAQYEDDWPLYRLRRGLGGLLLLLVAGLFIFGWLQLRELQTDVHSLETIGEQQHRRANAEADVITQFFESAVDRETEFDTLEGEVHALRDRLDYAGLPDICDILDDYPVNLRYLDAGRSLAWEARSELMDILRCR